MKNSAPSKPTPSLSPPRPAIYHTSTTTYASSLSSRKSKNRNLILQDRRIAQYRALVKLKSVQFTNAEFEALRNLAPHVECEKKVQEARWRCKEELHKFKKEAKENEAELRKELNMRIGNQRVVHRDNEKLLEENVILKADIVAWEKENDKIMEANEVLVEELKVSNEDNEELMTSIEELLKEVKDLQKQLKSATETYKEAAEASKKWNEALTKHNELCVKQREEMMENDAQREMVLQQMRGEMLVRDEKIKRLEETEKDVVLKKMADEMQVKDERINFLVESEQERLKQLKGMRRERDGLPECGCVTPRCTCEEGGYKADDEMMEWVRQNGGEENRDSDSDYDTENTSDDCESEDYENEYESDEEDSVCEEGEATKSLPVANTKLNDHIETWVQDTIAKEEINLNKEEGDTQQEHEETNGLQYENAEHNAEVETSHEDDLRKGGNNLKENAWGAELNEGEEIKSLDAELKEATLQGEIAKREAHLAKEKYNALKGILERRLLAETQQKTRESKEVQLKSKSLQANNDEHKANIDTSREDFLAKVNSNLIKDIGEQSSVEETHKKSKQSEKLAKFHKPTFSISTTSTATIEFALQRLEWRHLTPSITCAPTPAPSVSSSEKKAAVGLLWEEEENEAREASRKWWLEEQARARQRRDEAEKKRRSEELRLDDEAEEQSHASEVESHGPPEEAEEERLRNAKKKKNKKNKPKKKTAPDPNAPSKPLAPFIFYMQTARLIIASDLGGLFPQDPLVDTEGQKRWAEMAEDDKKLWISAYTDNLALYNARVHAYKNGFPNAADWSDLQAIEHAERNNVENLPGGQLFLVNELTPAERKMVKVRMKEQEVEMKERVEWDRRGRERRRAPDGTWIETGSRWAD